MSAGASSSGPSAAYLKQSVSTPCLTSIVGAEGSWLVGTDGSRYLDFHGNSRSHLSFPGTEHVPPFGCFRDHFAPGHRADEPHTAECGRPLAELIDYTLRVQGDVAAVIAEPMRALPTPAPPGFWASVRRSCDETGTLLIFDEIPTGLGRTGRFSASEHEGVVPDLLVWGKGLGGGAIPVAAVIAKPELDVAQEWALGHYTHEKNPLMARAGLTTLEIIDDERLVERAGAEFLDRLRGLAARYDVVADVRGRGLFFGVELVSSTDAVSPDHTCAEAVLYACLRRGLSFKTTMRSVLTLTPPLTISDGELEQALEILEASFAEVAAT